jgi:hypothetical protein
MIRITIIDSLLNRATAEPTPTWRDPVNDNHLHVNQILGNDRSYAVERLAKPSCRLS